MAVSDFPDPPEGEEWHNPNNLTPEQVEVDIDNWRLCLKSEVNNQAIKQYEDYQFYYPYGNIKWRRPVVLLQENTFRTKKPLPEKPKEPEYVPFGPEDIEPQMVFRDKQTNRESIVLSWDSDGIDHGMMDRNSYLGLKQHYEYKSTRDPNWRDSPWLPCHKLKKV